MNKTILNYINKLEGYKTAIKSLHWSSRNMSEHKLWDDIADSVNGIQDNVSEMEQGINGRIKLNMLSPIKYTISSQEKALNDMLKDTKYVYKSIENLEEYIGIRSELESFMGELNKYKYLMRMAVRDKALNESIRKTLRKNLLREYTTTRFNTPDETGLKDRRNKYTFTYADSNAYPFLYAIDQHQLIIGNPGDIHRHLFNQLKVDLEDNSVSNDSEESEFDMEHFKHYYPEYSNSIYNRYFRRGRYRNMSNDDGFEDNWQNNMSDDDDLNPSEISDVYPYGEPYPYSRRDYDTNYPGYGENSNPKRSYNYLTKKNVIAGRIWVVDDERMPDVSCIITAWNLEKYIPNIAEELCDKMNVDYFGALFTDGEKVMKVYDMDEYVPEAPDMKELIQVIHLANQEDKREYFSSFRQDRDANIAKQNRENGWGNATQAEVNFWRNKGLDESIRRKKKRLHR